MLNTALVEGYVDEIRLARQLNVSPTQVILWAKGAAFPHPTIFKLVLAQIGRSDVSIPSYSRRR